MIDSAQVIIVGAGITGLALAHELTAHHGVDNVCVLEASSRAGGVIETLHQNGFTLEQGPFSVMPRSDAFRKLLGELDLNVQSADANASKKRYILRRGQLRIVPTSPVSMLNTPLLSPIGRMRLIAGIIASRSRPGEVDETIAQVAARRLGREASDYLAGPACVGIFAAEADELSFDACIPTYALPDRQAGSVMGMIKSAKQKQQLPSQTSSPSPSSSRPAMIGFDGGLQTLTDRLAESLGPRLRLDCLVNSIEQDGDGYVVTCGGSVIHADAVICTGSPEITCRLIAPFAPDVADELHAVELAGLGVVHFGFRREDVGHSLDGFGFLVPKSESAEPLLGAIWPGSIFPTAAPDGHVLIRAMVGGTRWPDALNWSHDELAGRTYDALMPLLGLRAKPVLTQVRCWPQAIPVYSPGHCARVDHVRVALHTNAPGLWCEGNWCGGLGVNDRIVAAHAVAGEIAQFVESRRACRNPELMMKEAV